MNRINFNNINPADYLNLEEQLAYCDNADPGIYLLHFVGRDNLNRAGILKVTNGGIFQLWQKRREVYARRPFHGITNRWGSADSYDDLLQFAKNGFLPYRPNTLNATICPEPSEEFFLDVASNKKEYSWDKPSKREETFNDRYFLEFEKFKTTYDDWNFLKPTSDMFEGQFQISVSEVSVPDILFNIILGTKDSLEREKRRALYQSHFQTLKAQARYF